MIDRTAACIAMCLGVCCSVMGQETAATPRAMELERLKERKSAAQATQISAVQAAGSDAEAAGAAIEEYQAQNFPLQFLDFAKAANDAESLEACRTIIREFYFSPQRYSAMRLVELRHLNRPGVDAFFLDLVHGYADDPRAEQLLRKGIEAGNEASRAHATYQLARLLISRRNLCLDNPEERAVLEELFGKEPVAELSSEQGANAIESLLTQVRDQYGEADYFGYRMGDRASQDLFEIQHLEVGETAPETQGPDSAGNVFRLSEYRGRIVVIVFWAHWCGGCMAALPEETKFVTEMQGRPFVWLGVNGDDDVELLRSAEQDGTVNFRSWHDGEEGPISGQWNVWGWPKLYVIDAEGVIRYKSRLAVDFEKAAPFIETLVATLEREASETRDE